MIAQFWTRPRIVVATMKPGSPEFAEVLTLVDRAYGPEAVQHFEDDPRSWRRRRNRQDRDGVADAQAEMDAWQDVLDELIAILERVRRAS